MPSVKVAKEYLEKARTKAEKETALRWLDRAYKEQAAKAKPRRSEHRKKGRWS